MSLISIDRSPKPYQPKTGEDISFSAIGIRTNPIIGNLRILTKARMKVRLIRPIEAIAGEVITWGKGDDKWFDTDLIGEISPYTKPVIIPPQNPSE